MNLGEGRRQRTHVTNLAAPDAYRRGDASPELDRRAVVELRLQLRTAKLRCGHDRRIGRTALLGIAEAFSTQTGRVIGTTSRLRWPTLGNPAGSHVPSGTGCPSAP